MSTIRTILRRVLGLQGEPRQLTEDDLRVLDHAYAALMALLALGSVALLITIFSRQTCS